MGAEKMPEGERGEGNYTASKDYDERSEKFIEKNRDKLAEMARQAADALGSPEGEDLTEAEAEGRSHARD